MAVYHPRMARVSFDSAHQVHFFYNSSKGLAFKIIGKIAHKSLENDFQLSQVVQWTPPHTHTPHTPSEEEMDSAGCFSLCMRP